MHTPVETRPFPLSSTGRGAKSPGVGVCCDTPVIPLAVDFEHIAESAAAYVTFARRKEFSDRLRDNRAARAPARIRPLLKIPGTTPSLAAPYATTSSGSCKRSDGV